MPEGPELRLAAQFVNSVGSRYTFGGAVIKSDLATKHQEVDFKATAYHVSAQSRGKEIKVFLQPEGKGAGATCAKGREPVRHLLFRFGMSGSFQFHTAEEEGIPKHAHLRFVTKDKKFMLSFVDYRRFGRWHVNEDWGADRGPDIIDEYTEFRKNVLDNLDKTEFDKAICEAMLNQKYFNGVGNYLRAEVLYRAGVAPFAKARDALQHLTEAEEGGAPAKKKAKKEEDLLYLCNVVMREVLDLSGNPYIEPGTDSSGQLYHQDSQKEQSNFNDWLQCYYQEGMKNLVDRNGRTIWFSGEAGPMKPANSKSRSPVKKKGKKTKQEDHDYPVKVKKEENGTPPSKQSETSANKKSSKKKQVKVKNEVKEENGTSEASTKKSSRRKPDKVSTIKDQSSNGTLTLSPLKTRGQRKR